MLFLVTQSHQWYSWGPPNMQCRLCTSCWTYWKKYGGLKMPTRLDGERPGPNRNNSVCIFTVFIYCSVDSATTIKRGRWGSTLFACQLPSVLSKILVSLSGQSGINGERQNAFVFVRRTSNLQDIWQSYSCMNFVQSCTVLVALQLTSTRHLYQKRCPYLLHLPTQFLSPDPLLSNTFVYFLFIPSCNSIYR